MTLAKKSGRFANLKRLAKLYLKSKIGMAGIIIILFFAALAVFSPQVAPVRPLNNQVAAAFDIPSWAVIFPQYRSTAVTRYIVNSAFVGQSDISSWEISGPNLTEQFSAPPSSGTDSLLVNASISGEMTPEEENTTADPLLPGGVTFLSMSEPFAFSGSPPAHFEASVSFDLLKMTNISTIYVNMVISNAKGNYPLSSTLSYDLASTITLNQRDVGTWQKVTIDSGLLQTAEIPVFSGNRSPQDVVFNGTGTYNFTVQLRGVPVANPSNSSSISAYVASASLHLDGGAYGILGTDSLGNDVWSQFVWGSRVSLEIGVSAGVGAVGLGALAGVAAGYLGGLWDEILSRITDFVLVLPFLPLLIICVEIISSNPFLLSQVYFWIIALFIVISWPLIAKIIRSQVLTVKERQYVEASRAVGGGTGHILRRHILPNVMGLVYSQVALNVAGFILLEAALDFLALSAHQVGVVSWGLMLTNALPYAIGDSAASHVWWWFLPPGVSIASLSLAFVLVGFALDSIFNPRLRAR